MKLFDSKYYPSLMLLLILSVLVLTMFNIGSILEKDSNNFMGNNQENSISGLVSLNLNSNYEEKAISQMAYFYYYGIIGILCLLVYVLIKFIYRR